MEDTERKQRGKNKAKEEILGEGQGKKRELERGKKAKDVSVQKERERDIKGIARNIREAKEI
jgi:hypothetical protein